MKKFTITIDKDAFLAFTFKAIFGISAGSCVMYGIKRGLGRYWT